MVFTITAFFLSGVAATIGVLRKDIWGGVYFVALAGVGIQYATILYGTNG
ncbi:MAG: hypothetical protein ACPGMR_03435 [Pontibacterium sp.]